MVLPVAHRLGGLRAVRRQIRRRTGSLILLARWPRLLYAINGPGDAWLGHLLTVQREPKQPLSLGDVSSRLGLARPSEIGINILLPPVLILYTVHSCALSRIKECGILLLVDAVFSGSCKTLPLLWLKHLATLQALRPQITDGHLDMDGPGPTPTDPRP